MGGFNKASDYLYGELLNLLELPGYSDEDYVRDLNDYNNDFTKSGTEWKESE